MEFNSNVAKIVTIVSDMIKNVMKKGPIYHCQFPRKSLKGFIRVKTKNCSRKGQLFKFYNLVKDEPVFPYFLLNYLTEIL